MDKHLQSEQKLQLHTYLDAATILGKAMEKSWSNHKEPATFIRKYVHANLRLFILPPLNPLGTGANIMKDYILFIVETMLLSGAVPPTGWCEPAKMWQLIRVSGTSLEAAQALVQKWENNTISEKRKKANMDRLLKALRQSPLHCNKLADMLTQPTML